jgi:hypothetical protein
MSSHRPLDAPSVDLFKDSAFEWRFRPEYPLHLMKILCPLLLLAVSNLPAADRVKIAEDDAAHSAYGGGWNTGQNVGTGFAAWFLRSSGVLDEDSHGGFFIATDDNQQTSAVALSGKTFSIFANGKGHEICVAFRAFNAPLQTGDAFSLLMQGGTFRRKFESDDPTPGATGFSLRSGVANIDTSELTAGERLRVANEQGEENYQISDGLPDRDSGILVNPSGVSVAVLLTGPDSYDLEITDLDSKKTHRLPGRKLGGTPGAPIESFTVFNIDGEDGDAGFNGFQVTRGLTSMPR